MGVNLFKARLNFRAARKHELIHEQQRTEAEAEKMISSEWQKMSDKEKEKWKQAVQPGGGRSTTTTTSASAVGGPASAGKHGKDTTSANTTPLPLRSDEMRAQSYQAGAAGDNLSHTGTAAPGAEIMEQHGQLPVFSAASSEQKNATRATVGKQSVTENKSSLPQGGSAAENNIKEAPSVDAKQASSSSSSSTSWAARMREEQAQKWQTEVNELRKQPVKRVRADGGDPDSLITEEEAKKRKKEKQKERAQQKKAESATPIAVFGQRKKDNTGATGASEPHESLVSLARRVENWKQQQQHAVQERPQLTIEDAARSLMQPKLQADDRLWAASGTAAAGGGINLLGDEKTNQGGGPHHDISDEQSFENGSLLQVRDTTDARDLRTVLKDGVKTLVQQEKLRATLALAKKAAAEGAVTSSSSVLNGVTASRVAPAGTEATMGGISSATKENRLL
ncbi:unnamed protein product [Amoebophrya sp. A120]|nr:unnamed protein product [Amoebophrya sp. A120]|eukprot:GSA120T00006059001.1